MSLNTAQQVYLSVGLIAFAGTIIFIGTSLYVAYAKIDLLLGYLSNCPVVMNRVPLKKSGPWGRIYLLGGVISVLMTPKIYLRDGGADAQDLNKFPIEIKWKLIFLHWWGVFFVSIIFGLTIVKKLGVV